MGLPMYSDYWTYQSVRNQYADGRKKETNLKKGPGHFNGDMSLPSSTGGNTCANNTYNSVLPFPKDKIAYFYSSTIPIM